MTHIEHGQKVLTVTPDISFAERHQQSKRPGRQDLELKMISPAINESREPFLIAGLLKWSAPIKQSSGLRS
jgi:hypothetical protein